ncbi:AAA family ATPase [Sulfolobus sp. E5-1-F]|uniref:(d)CMP kinase n=1 Tax=Sulfolobaceae TaxID=118883 RepID=UPI001294B80E|nr:MULTISPECIES: AAA family ATPase [unclassified Sulfolobus]QGA54536.1 AAA family ATPase [Sulfolobus sp. E5-1-F]QGA69570.1 AAA family ATPase [Sulfolobus sp. E11-6]
MIIVISGPPGSGKTSVAIKLANELSYKFISAGKIFRDIAQKMGIDIINLNKFAESNFDIDKMVDKKIFEYILNEKNLIVESHIAGWLFREYTNIAIYLWAPLKIRANRIAIRDNVSFDEAISQIVKREYMHYKRFNKFYGIDINDLSVFDLVINTSNIDVNNTVKLILTYLSSVSQNPQPLKEKNIKDK